MMKNIRNVMVAIAVMVGTMVATAQTKVAHIDSNKLLSEMPEMKNAQAQLQKLSKTYEDEIQASIKEYQVKLQSLQNEISALTEEQLKARQAEFEKKGKDIDTMRANIQQAQQNASQELQKKQESLIAPLLEKAKKAIEKVAKAQGFHYVLDSAQQGGNNVLFADGKDLYNDVKKELGF